MMQVTVKKLITTIDSDKDLKAEFDEEVALISSFDHLNIIKLLAITTEEYPYWMIFEFMEFGPLDLFVSKAKPSDVVEETQGVYTFIFV